MLDEPVIVAMWGGIENSFCATKGAPGLPPGEACASWSLWFAIAANVASVWPERAMVPEFRPSVVLGAWKPTFRESFCGRWLPHDRLARLKKGGRLAR
ncbi:hypothetical protein CCR95_22345 [Thiocystis minor]|nr:hypothetical protein [Thiocystis minor]